MERHAFVLTSILLCGLFLIAFAPPKDAFYPAHDFLDVTFVQYALRSQIPRFLFNLKATIPIVGGLLLSATGFSDFSIEPNLYLIFSPFTAFAVGEVLFRGIGFVGLYLLLSEYVLPSFEGRKVVSAGTAVLFSLMPYWDNAATITLQPLLAYSIISLCLRRHQIASWIVVILFPFFSYPALGGFAVVAVCGVFALYALVLRKAYARTLLMVVAAIVGVSAVLEFRLIHLVFFSDFVSHRVEWHLEKNPTLANFIQLLTNNVLFGEYDMHSGQFPVPLLAIGAVAALLVSRAFHLPAPRNKDAIAISVRRLVWLLAGALLIGVLVAGENSGLTNLAASFPVPFQISRMNVLHPVIWQVAFALAASILCLSAPGYSRAIGLAFAIAAIAQGVLSSHSVVPRVAALTKLPLCKVLRRVANCGATNIYDYYKIDVYHDLAQQIGRPQGDYWVASLDIDPMIAAFNGFKTIDGYTAIYPLEYKHRFEKIIAAELDKNPALSQYFRGWGNRVYLFHDASRGPLEIDFCRAYALGAEYILTPTDLAGSDILALAASSHGMRAYRIEPGACVTETKPVHLR